MRPTASNSKVLENPFNGLKVDMFLVRVVYQKLILVQQNFLTLSAFSQYLRSNPKFLVVQDCVHWVVDLKASKVPVKPKKAQPNKGWKNRLASILSSLKRDCTNTVVVDGPFGVQHLVYDVETVRKMVGASAHFKTLLKHDPDYRMCLKKHYFLPTRQLMLEANEMKLWKIRTCLEGLFEEPQGVQFSKTERKSSGN